MAISFKNFRVNTSVNTNGNSVEANEITLLTGVPSGTIVKTLEVISGDESSILNIIRKDAAGMIYANIKVDLKANDYLVLWEGFFVIPQGHKLCVSADSNKVTVVANAVEMS